MPSLIRALSASRRASSRCVCDRLDTAGEVRITGPAAWLTGGRLTVGDICCVCPNAGPFEREPHAAEVKVNPARRISSHIPRHKASEGAEAEGGSRPGMNPLSDLQKLFNSVAGAAPG